ncbi:hypothetical protein HETIRDRAFT_164354 [Heterobasidion irregulare TC 32-1]|uniref:Uncharacterized protein n=1 Tax=Heterobasidion irregulare (strain TC 32-1) TaxID=747525 RepID=W4JR04_HETIT|nr:uncharacterized protein HETIRDRAFT_164354 [Heterobasidion irregulare TC 32-1]ETW75520.1 hypothetical protein HETIRDRAFT_164354 [Heterobasidion irregulare TC 32-1]
MPKFSKLVNPCNPLRRILRDAVKSMDGLRSMAVVGKLRRVDSRLSITTRPFETSIPRSPGTRSRRSYCMALLNEVDDTVIVTALDSLPFCCHADLITMNRSQLVDVAQVFNLYLPAALQIDLDPSQPDDYIRNTIEILVGLRLGQNKERNTPSPTPPAVPSRASYISVGTPLHPVVEEDEGFASMRARRRTSSEPRLSLAPAPVPRLIITEPDSPTPKRAPRSKSAMVLGSTCGSEESHSPGGIPHQPDSLLNAIPSRARYRPKVHEPVSASTPSIRAASQPSVTVDVGS